MKVSLYRMFSIHTCAMHCNTLYTCKLKRHSCESIRELHPVALYFNDTEPSSDAFGLLSSQQKPLMQHAKQPLLSVNKYGSRSDAMVDGLNLKSRAITFSRDCQCILSLELKTESTMHSLTVKREKGEMLRFDDRNEPSHGC